uniref:Uncharacterized protein n=1 Tax=Glossina pallidipes TaxID=7398 RepID=A0A1B0A5A2_GLOPL
MTMFVISNKTSHTSFGNSNNETKNTETKTLLSKKRTNVLCCGLGQMFNTLYSYSRQKILKLSRYRSKEGPTWWGLGQKSSNSKALFYTDFPHKILLLPYEGYDFGRKLGFAIKIIPKGLLLG